MPDINVQITEAQPINVQLGDLVSVGGAGTWGSITGTLSDQTDLQSALNTKADTSAIPTKNSQLVNDEGYVKTDTTYTAGANMSLTGTTFSANKQTDNNYTTADKNKLAGIESNAQVNVNADWNASSGDAQILNKPTIPDTSGLVTKTTTVNGHALSSDVTVSKSDVGLSNVTNDTQVKVSDVDTTTTLGTSDTKVPSQKATKTYVDNKNASDTPYDDTILATLGAPGDDVQEVVDNFGLAMAQFGQTTFQDINDLRNDKEDLANKDTDGTLAANSDTKYPSQKAVKTYVDTKDGQNVKLTGNQTVAGLKTFSSIPEVPNNPTGGTRVANKNYVDSKTANLAYDLRGSGSPYGSVTPPAKGSYYTDTNQTNGAYRWISTGTTNTSWVILDGNTGAIDIKALPDSDICTWSVLTIQRSGNVVSLNGLLGTFTSTGTWLTIPAGFRPPTQRRGIALTRLSVITDTWLNTDGELSTSNTGPTNNGTINETWITNEPWPVTLP